MYRGITIAFLGLVLSACAQSPVQHVKETLSLKAQADTYYAKRDCANAVPLYEKLNEAMPKYTEGWLHIGNCNVYLNKLDEAVVAYRKALERDPSYIKAWYNLAHTQARMLGTTVSDMYRNVDNTDPRAVEVRRFAMDVLEPFGMKSDNDIAPEQATVPQAVTSPEE